MEGDVGRGEATLLRRTVTIESQAHGRSPWLSVSAAAQANLHCWREETAHLWVQGIDAQSTWWESQTLVRKRRYTTYSGRSSRYGKNDSNATHVRHYDLVNKLNLILSPKGTPMSKLQSSGVSESSSVNEVVDDSRPPTMLHIPTKFEHFPGNSSPAGGFHHPTFPTLAPTGLTFSLPIASTASPCEATSEISQVRPLPPLPNPAITATATVATATSSVSPEDLSPRSASPLIRIHPTPGLQTTLWSYLLTAFNAFNVPSGLQFTFHILLVLRTRTHAYS